ncbi:MAG: DNA translocase FtsK [Prolixibacteraceae bacterium]|jgi:S-DNA-T family DNA segregation ATPase FtsK/SpoIIIE|nr:DNA translocase FtsK [Prolixibacteraceae bacterium]
MANRKKQNQKKSKTASKSGNANDTIKIEKFKLVAGISLIIIATYLLFAFGSFLFNAGADQSKLQINWFQLIKDSTIKVENITGKSGAWLADVFINRWFGLSSFMFIYLLIIYSAKLIHRPVKALFGKTVKTVIAIIWLSIALGYIFQSKYPELYIYPGGSYGYHISLWINALTGKIGTFFILFFTLITFLIIQSDSFFHFLTPNKKSKKNPEGDYIDEATKANTKNTETSGFSLSEEAENFKQNFGDDTEIFINDEDERLTNENNNADGSSFSNARNINSSQTNQTTPRNKSEDEIISTKSIGNENDTDDLEMTVEIKEEQTGDIKNKPMEDYDPTLDLSHYKYPGLDLLEDYSHLKSEVSDEELIENKNRIVETLKNFKIEILKIKATIGPTVTLYEIVPAQGIRISKIKNLEDDIALSLAALGIRIIAPIPGRGTIGIEVPNRNPQVVSMRSIIASKKFQETTAELPIAMGRTISNETFVFDLTKMPHILVAGATGQGKSVGLNAIIASILYKKHPSQVKFVFIDPKKVELNLYSTIEKHFLAKLPDAEEPIITDVEKVKATLNSVGIEMDRRYDLLKLAHARNLKEYNKKFIERKLNPEKGHRFLPYIVVVIDEFADLIMTAGKEIELPIARIAQLARAVGIHMIIATQRPSANIITGIIKANFPSRIAFKVASMIDSRTILDQPGANQLIGKGDMLFASGSEVIRLQCALVDTPEVENICQHIADQQAYPTAYLLPEYVGDDSDAPGAVDLNNRDEYFDDAARLVVLNQQGSTSMIQRKFSIGYNRAGRIMDQLEAAGIVGPSEGSKTRKVQLQDEYSLEQLLNNI